MDLSNKEMIHVKKGNLEYLQFRKLLKYEDKLFHAFMLKDTRCNRENILNHINYIKKELDIKNVVKTNQTHTDIIRDINSFDREETEKKTIEVDGLITNKEEEYLISLEADCVPVILYDPKEEVIANIHSGWKGTISKITQNAIRLMKENYNVKEENVLAFIGPCIQKCHFEVKEDVESIFIDTFKDNKELNNIVLKNKDNNNSNKIYIDLVKANIEILKEAGIKEANITTSNICTACNYNFLSSYRIEGLKAGLNLCIVGLKK